MFVVYMGHESILRWDKPPTVLTPVTVVIVCLIYMPIKFIPFNVNIIAHSTNPNLFHIVIKTTKHQGINFNICFAFCPHWHIYNNQNMLYFNEIIMQRAKVETYLWFRLT